MPAHDLSTEIVRVACVQMCSGDDMDANLEQAGRWLCEAVAQGAQWVVLPENFSFIGADDASKYAVAECAEDSRVLAWLSWQSQALALMLIGGSVLLTHPASSKLRNTCPVYAPSGVCLGMYDKIHLFDMDMAETCYRESDVMRPGDHPVSVHAGAWQAGLSICYDLRFSDLYHHYRKAGCHAVCVPSAFTVPTGKVHWETLLRSRAIENQIYVLAASQTGKHPGGRETYGHAMIIDPWGDVLAAADQDEGVIVAEMSMARLQSVRQAMPMLC